MRNANMGLLRHGIILVPVPSLSEVEPLAMEAIDFKLKKGHSGI